MTLNGAMDEENEQFGFHHFATRFADLAAEAKSYGVSAVVLLHGDDPINGVVTYLKVAPVDPFMQAGMIQHALWELRPQ